MTSPDIALFLALSLSGLAFLITGIKWWLSEGVSAERAASLCVMTGICTCLCAVWCTWGPFGFGVAVCVLIFLASIMMLSRPAGGNAP